MDRGKKMGGRNRGRRGEGTWDVEREKRREGEGEQVQEKRPSGAARMGHPPPPLTTSSMTGSGLAASSCSLTFSSTRGRKTTRGAGRGCHLPGDRAAATAREEGASRSWVDLPRSLGPQPARRKTLDGSSGGRLGAPRMNASGAKQAAGTDRARLRPQL